MMRAETAVILASQGDRSKEKNMLGAYTQTIKPFSTHQKQEADQRASVANK